MSWGFVAGRSYPLSEMVRRFGGNKQSGIIPSKIEKVVILISDPKNRRIYDNRWRDGGLFDYFGQGRNGPMEWTANNRAVRDHFAEGRSLLFFETDGKLKRFVGEFILNGYRQEQTLGEDKQPRKAIIFELQPVATIEDEGFAEPTPPTLPLKELRMRAYEAANETAGKKGGARTVYFRSQDIHRYVLARAKHHCEASNCGKPGPFERKGGGLYLEAHHTLRRCDAGPDAPTHVIALCPACHRRVHFGVDGETYNLQLVEDLKVIEEMAEAAVA